MLRCIALSTLLQIREHYSRRKNKKKTQNRPRSKINTLEKSGEQDLYSQSSTCDNRNISLMVKFGTRQAQHKNEFVTLITSRPYSVNQQ